MAGASESAEHSLTPSNLRDGMRCSDRLRLERSSRAGPSSAGGAAPQTIGEAEGDGAEERS